MVKPRPGKSRRHRRRFSGIRTATETVKKGVRFVERKDGSRYPKLSSIPVSPSVLDIYKELKRKQKKQVALPAKHSKGKK